MLCRAAVQGLPLSSLRGKHQLAAPVAQYQYESCFTWGSCDNAVSTAGHCCWTPDNTMQMSWHALMQGWRNEELLRRKKINPVSSLRNVSDALPSLSSQTAADTPKRTLSDSIWRLGAASESLEETQPHVLTDLM